MDVISSNGRGLTLEAYAARKGLDPHRLARWGVRTTVNPYTGEPCVSLPYYGADGQLSRMKYRTPTGTCWDQQRGTLLTLYGLWWLPRASQFRPVILVEGESDCHAAWSRQVTALGLPGAQTWRPGWAVHFAGRPAYIWREPGKPDRDGKVPSTKMLERVAADLPKARVIQPPEGIKDLCDLHIAEPANFALELHQLLEAAAPIRDLVIPRPHPTVRVWRDTSQRATADELPIAHAKAMPLDGLMERLGFDVKGRGPEKRMLCPFHDDTRPSLHISVKKNLWHCWVCDMGGDSIAFVQRWQGLAFRDAVRAVLR